MATALVAADIIKVSFYCSAFAQESINSIHYRVDTITGGTFSDVQVADKFSALNAPLMKAWMSSQAVYDGVRVQRIRPTKAPYVVSVDAAGVGAIVGDLLPTQAAAVVDKLTATVTMGARGRVFLGFFPEGANTVDGDIEAASVALINTWAQNLLVNKVFTDGGATITLVPVIWSQKFLAAKDVTAFKLPDTWATMKSRSQINQGDKLGPGKL